MDRDPAARFVGHDLHHARPLLEANADKLAGAAIRMKTGDSPADEPGSVFAQDSPVDGKVRFKVDQVGREDHVNFGLDFYVSVQG